MSADIISNFFGYYRIILGAIVLAYFGITALDRIKGMLRF